ncbi:MAG: SAM-dependent methyltransferase [Nitrospirales bacterium]|nr:MAG: SAM-dependent methyltransferase [Nitrospirales bacterium]
MECIDFISSLHTVSKRNYLQRVVEHDKTVCAEVATRFGKEYWDGDRRYGYGGYRYDGRWRAVAEAMIRHYGLSQNACILDVGCGRGFLLYEFTQLLSNATVVGIDASRYGIQTAKPELQGCLQLAKAENLPFNDQSFDFVYSVNTLHNLYNYQLSRALSEIERVSRGSKYVVVEAYRNEREKVNLMYWQLTCRAFHTPEEWRWIYQQAGYTGDYSNIFFE